MKWISADSMLFLHGSPSMRREWIEIYYITDGKIINGSPSMRREWIEMTNGVDGAGEKIVSLHAEGVD